jgi:hypothetical protein
MPLLNQLDLATLPDVKSWLGVVPSESDATIARLITATSRAILAKLNRPSILPMVWTDRYDARVGMRRIVLRNWPVISVSSVEIGPTLTSALNPQMTTPPSPTTFADYIIDTDPYNGMPPGAPIGLSFVSDPSYFSVYKQQSIAVTYTAGYQDTAEISIPANGAPISPTPNYGRWASDMGVVNLQTGEPFVAAAASNAPLPSGEYVVSPTGVYTFSPADATTPMKLTFGYVPMDLVQACVEATAQRFSASTRIGVRSKSLGGQESVSYDMAAIPAAVMDAIQPYKRVTMP